MKRTAPQRVFNAFNMAFLMLFALTILVPYLYVASVSLNDTSVSANVGLMLWPKRVTLANYTALFRNDNIARAFVVTIVRVVVGVSLHFIVEFPAAYALSKRYLPHRRAISTYLIIPTYISGGLVATYLLYSNIGLLNNPLVYVLPGLFGFFTFTLFRTYLAGISDSFEESAMIDGAGAFRIMTAIYIPLCLPIIATFVLLESVSHWNDWTTTLYYMTAEKWNTLQYELQRVLNESERITSLIRAAVEAGDMPPNVTARTGMGLKNAQIIISTLPIVLVYPFLQKYFIQGLTLGGVKE
ncbi:MAG: carbohydrate ABC transporter permease [Clostridiales bacterium]|nr:carbohydrate ABC transporter permease [Clostridiales bacterium]